MSVFKKLMQARVKLQNMKLEKTGHNKFAGYYYFELGDFLPQTQEIFTELGLCGVVSFSAETATLQIVDTDDFENKESPIVVITSPMGSAALKGCHEVQNIGAVETYQRRYLWVSAMEIVEHDALDATTGDEKKQGKPLSAPVNPNDIGKNFWNNAVGEQKECLESYLRSAVDYLAADDAGSAASFFYTKIHDMEEQAAIWSQLDSKQRAAIKKFKPEQKAS